MKKLLAILCAVGFGVSLEAATVGSNETNARAITLSATQLDLSVTLVEEEEEGWDDDWGDDDWGDDDWGDDDWGDDGSWFSSGVYYFKASLKKNTAYTIWMDGSKAGEIVLDSYPYGEMMYETPSASFSAVEQQVDSKGVTHYISWMRAEDWASEDPNSWTYYISLSGEVGDKVTFHAVQGEKSFLPDGVADNPKTLVFADTEKTEGYKITDEGSYYFKADLTAGRKYLFRTTGGTAKTNVAVRVDASHEYVLEQDLAHQDAYNAAIALFPKASGTYRFIVSGPSAGAAFGVVYSSVPVRKIEDHPCVTLAENEKKTFKPGRLVADAAFYDEIVDEQLFRFTAGKGERWIIDATGADRAVRMCLYDAKGTFIKANDGVGDGTHDVRIGYDIAAAGDYYVGVCDPALAQTNQVVCSSTTIVARRVTPEEDVVEPLAPCAAPISADPVQDGTSVGPFVLNDALWTQTVSLNVRKEIAYKVKTALVDGVTELSLHATMFKLSGSKEVVVGDFKDVDLTPGVYESQIKFTAAENATYYIRIRVGEGEGLDFPAFNVCSLGYSTETDQLGSLNVRIRGAADATWSLDSEKVTYRGGDSVLAVGTHTVKFSKASGFSTPADETVTVQAGKEPTVVVGTYSDTFDPKDDTYGGATKLSVSSSESEVSRTLWGKDDTGKVADAADWFVVTAKDGVYFNFRLDDIVGDPVFSVYGQEGGKPSAEPLPAAAGVTSVGKLVLGAGTFYLCVAHGSSESLDSSYTLVSSSANVGSIKFAKASVSTKKTAGTVSLSVNRTSKEGRVRVKYATVAGTARPGERYVAQSGVLEWENGDSSARTVEIKLIPDLVAVYGGDTAFEVKLEPMPEEELGEDEYPAQITVDTCEVVVKETASKSVTTVEQAYAKTQPKVASVKTEDTALRAGTFFGVLAEDGSQLTNGLPKLASVTLTTAVKGDADTLSAKVALAGKTYAFKTNSKDPEEWEELEDGYKRIVLKLVTKSPAATNELTITVKDGSTLDEDAWMTAGGKAELCMTVPDAKGSGAQEGIRYVGDIFRQNAKIDDYLKAVADTFYGYYTFALFPEGVSSADGIPAGNGYLTVKVDNKGTATVAGLLADGTKVSCKVTAAAIREDETSANGHAMYLPVYQAKSPYCFGGTIKLTAKSGTTLPDEDFVRVVDSAETLVWNNDNAALTYFNEEGWRITCSPVGGWYDTVMNLEAYYLNYAIKVGTADIGEFPTEALADASYSYVTDVQPNGEPAAFENDVLSTAKRSLVKVGKLYDLVDSVNPCNVQLKLARATGVVTGSFSLWGESDDGLAQKEIKGIKHNGVLLLARDDFGALDADAISAGFCSASVTVKDEDDRGRTASRKWTYSLPFNLLGIAQNGEDAWVQDQGENPDLAN